MKFLVSSLFVVFLVSSAGRAQKGDSFARIPTAGGGKCQHDDGQQDCPSGLTSTNYILAENGTSSCPDGYEGVPESDCVEAWFKLACAETHAGRNRCVWLPKRGFEVVNWTNQPPGCEANTLATNGKGWRPRFNTASPGNNINWQYQRICQWVPTTTTTTTTTTALDLSGTYRLKQKSSGRWMDAHTGGVNGWTVFTKTSQNNPTQKWKFTKVGGSGPTSGEYRIQHKSNDRYVDAYHNSNDYLMVTREKQNDDTQIWIVSATTPDGYYTLQQKETNRYVDAHETGRHRMVTRGAQNNDSQKWKLVSV